MDLKRALHHLSVELFADFRGKVNNAGARSLMAKRCKEILKGIDPESRDYDVEVTGKKRNEYDVVIREIPRSIAASFSFGEYIAPKPEPIELPEEAKVKILSAFEFKKIDASLVYAIRQAVRRYVADEMYISPEKFFVTIDTSNASRGEIGVSAHYYPKCNHCEARSTQDITGIGDFVCESHINNEMV